MKITKAKPADALCYNNPTGIAFYRSLGVAFIPEEYPTAKKPEKYYTVVTTNPKLMKRQ